jgi:hypothetical protein
MECVKVGPPLAWSGPRRGSRGFWEVPVRSVGSLTFTLPPLTPIRLCPRLWKGEIPPALKAPIPGVSPRFPATMVPPRTVLTPEVFKLAMPPMPTVELFVTVE